MSDVVVGKKLAALSYLGDQLRWRLRKGHVVNVFQEAQRKNPFFTPANIEFAFRHVINYYLHPDKLRRWIRPYVTGLSSTSPRTVGIVTAGNIPLVGFHDLLVGYISPHSLQVKLSRNASVLLPWIFETLSRYDPSVKERIHFVDRLRTIDAVIATGSNTSARYFEYYFREYPRIIRHTRRSMAIIDANTSDADLEKLGIDIFTYFGLGCRNVSLLWLPKGFHIERLHRAWQSQFASLIEHAKYANNYLYWKSILEVDRIPHHDFGFVLLKEEELLTSGLGVIHYAWYDDMKEVRRFYKAHRDQLQCIVCTNRHFCRDSSVKVAAAGKAQLPSLRDYADGVDTMAFLIKIGTPDSTI